MNSFSSDQMLLPSITHLLDINPKCDSIFPEAPRQSYVSDEEVANSLRLDCQRQPLKSISLTPPDSPVFSELTPPTCLLRMTLQESSQMVPNLDVHGILEHGFPTSYFQSLDNLEDLQNIMTSTTKQDMFDDTDAIEWSGIYIDDIEGIPSPTHSPPFDAPNFDESQDLAAIESLMLYPDPTRTERRKYNSVSTEESLQSDSGSDMGSCPSPTSTTRPFHSHHGPVKGKSGGRIHNYQRRTITKSLTELKQDGSKVAGSSTSERRKRGRPRKRLSEELGERDGGVSRRKQGRKAVKGSHLWEFILDLLKTDTYCPQYIKWEDKDSGVFRIVNSKVVANMWGDIKNNPRMTYEKLSRAMRYYYKREILERVDKARLVYKFGEKAEGWRESVVA